MSHARIEEVSDSDSDPSEGNISDLDDGEFDEREIIRKKGTTIAPIHDPERILPPQLSAAKAQHAPAIPTAANIPQRPTTQPQPQFQRRQQPQIPTGPMVDADGTRYQNAVDDSMYKDYQCIYPVYFDASRSRAQGRRVGREDAVANPLAREIVTACGWLRLETLFEPVKVHPKDWSNPGRVKVKVKGSNNPIVKNKHHLYTLIAKHLKENPTTLESAAKAAIPGAPPPDPSKPYPEPAVPKGWKMNKILPYHSAAMTGGGVSENFFKDMMSEMGGQLPAGFDPSALEAPPDKPESKRSQKPKRKIIRA